VRRGLMPGITQLGREVNGLAKDSGCANATRVVHGEVAPAETQTVTRSPARGGAGRGAMQAGRRQAS
jgi:hypothetical protein